MTQGTFSPKPGSKPQDRATLLPPACCPGHDRPGPCSECQRLATLRSAAHLAASVQAAQEWAHRAAA
jgi:hypothetical protein